ncbi:MAG: hypothetical protein ABIK73_07115 [candidate division WOR-3 bacterium]
MYNSPEDAIADIVDNIDFDFAEDVEGAKRVLRATSYLLSARPSGMSQVGASLNFDVGSIRDLHNAAKEFLKNRKPRRYKRTMLRRGFE